MALSDLEVFSEYAYDSMTETIDQKVHLFNEASNYAINMSTVRNQGDATHAAFFKEIDGLVVDRNPYVDDDDPGVDLEHSDHVSIKVGRRARMARIPSGQFRWIQRNPEEGGVIYGEQMAAATMQNHLNTAITCAAASIESIGSDVIHDHTGVDSGKLNQSAMASGAGKFEDRWEAIVAWIVHGASVHDVFQAALQNNERLFTFGNVSVMNDGFGRPIIATNSPALTAGAGATKTFKALGLVTNAVMVEDNDDFDSNVETSNGKTNIQRTIQAEWSINLSVKGSSWDIANGGKAPSEAALKTPENWVRDVTSVRNTAGVMVKTK